MTDQTNAPSAPSLNPASPPAEMSRSTPGNPQQAPQDNPRSHGHSPAMEARQQQQAPAEAMVKFADGTEHEEADLLSALGERAEAASRKATLPSSPDGYEIKLPEDFQAPEGVRFEFNQNNPALKAAKELAHKRGIDQATFSEMLGVYASTQMGEAIRNSQLRDVNLRQLGTAGPQRVDAVATWLQARAGADGKVMADFLRRFPSAPIVKTMENLMRAFSNQGGAEFSQSHRAAQEESAGRIPGYENMNFAQRRAAQMQQMFGGNRGGGRRGE